MDLTLGQEEMEMGLKWSTNLDENRPLGGVQISPMGQQIGALIGFSIKQTEVFRFITMYVIFFNLVYQGIWAGMIFGGTAIQTVILAIITIRSDWEKEVYTLIYFYQI
jgi:hypothetical protein